MLPPPSESLGTNKTGSNIASAPSESLGTNKTGSNIASPPSESLGTNKTGSNIASKHARKPEAHRPRVKKEFCLDSNDLGFICAGVSNVGGYKRNA